MTATGSAKNRTAKTKAKKPARAKRARKPLKAGRSLTRPTIRGFLFFVAGLAAGVLAYTAGRSEFLFAAGFLLVLPLAGLVMVRLRPLRLSVTRTFSPSVVSAGTSTVVELAVRNMARYSSASATWTDRIPWFPYTAGPGTLPVLAPGAVLVVARGARLGYTLRPTLRGVYDIGPLDVDYSDPFGLATARVEVGGSQSLYVVPLVVPLGDATSISVTGEGSARLIQHMAVGNDDDLMTREYRTGDALRRVHWRASARHGELMVRQEEQRSFPEARLLIDTRMDGYGGPIAEFGIHDTGFTWFEWCVTMIASLGVHLHRSGFLVRVLESDTRQIASLGDADQGSGQDIEFLLSLAGVRLSDSRKFVGGDVEERAQGNLGPIFAVVAEPSVDTLRWILAQRRPYETGVAFVIDTGNAHIWTALVEAGWTCIPVRDTDDPALVWASVGSFSALHDNAVGS
jgi:uncharacterized protein (DUF58 family)